MYIYTVYKPPTRRTVEKEVTVSTEEGVVCFVVIVVVLYTCSAARVPQATIPQEYQEM